MAISSSPSGASGDVTLGSYDAAAHVYLEQSVPPGPAVKAYLDAVAGLVGDGTVLEKICATYDVVLLSLPDRPGGWYCSGPCPGCATANLRGAVTRAQTGRASACSSTADTTCSVCSL